MNIVFMGTPDFAVPILEAVHERYGVGLVVTQPDKFVGRKRVLTAPPVKKMAETLNIPVFQPKRIRHDHETILAFKPDVIVTAAYGQIIPPALLNVQPYGAINIHASLLPLLRGGAPIQRAIMQQHTKTGITIMQMSEGMDEGPILMQRAIDIGPRETTLTLHDKLSQLGKTLVLEALEGLQKDTMTPQPQDASNATYAPNLKREEEHLDFTRDVFALDAHIRAFYPKPNTYAKLDATNLKIIAAHPAEKTQNHAKPGTIISLDEGIHIACGEGVLTIDRVQWPGKKALDAKTFMRGIGRTHLKVGMVLT